VPVIDPGADPGDDRLRRIMAVTDAALAHLDTDALFIELLDRVLTLINADTAAIMLLDRDSDQLVTIAAIGLEDEVRQGFRLRIGTGFTGRVAESRAPVIIDTVDARSVVSPVLRNTGIATLVGVPMLAGGELIGVMHVGTYQARRFTEEDVALLQMVADRAALAHQAGRNQADRAATLALQRSLLPARLPRADGIDLAARYVPGHQLGVGGDWYDVFALPSGYLGVVVGDVSGHGLRSAVVMGRLRSALRAYALIESNPATVLTFLDRKITHFEAGNLATILYARIDPDRQRMVVSVAGHLPPMLAAPDQPAKPLHLPVDLPVGVGDATPRRSTVVDLPSLATVVLYTDGLVERRGEMIDEGLGRLAAVVASDSAESVCAAIMASMDVGTAEDDIALLAIRRLT
jgi:sigma-B regulation protein RsbU (phosphoserine phosphatase)